MPAARRLLRRTLPALAVCAMLVACQQAPPPPPSNATPEKAVTTNLRLVATGDFDGLMKNRLPPADYAQWKTEWQATRAHAGAPSAARAQQFAAIMKKLTEPGAEARLEAQLAPELAKLHGGKGQPLPIFTGILKAAGQQMIAASPQLGPSQRTMAQRALDILIGWAGRTDFSNRKQAAKAIGIACATARELHVQTLAQWQALDYATAMRDYGILWNGLENVLQVYGLDVGKSLIDAQVTTVNEHGDQASVKLTMTLAGQPISGAWPMHLQAGHWYDTAMLAAWRKAHPAPAASVAAPAAAGSTLAASAATVSAPAASAPPSH